VIAMNRRSSLSLLAAGFASVIGASRARAQFTDQEVRNGAQITSTGNVNLEQSASGNQQVEVQVDGGWVSDDGIYRTQTGQVVINDGQVTSTGDVNVRQSASGNQRVVATLPQNDGYYDGKPADTCEVGKVIADPNGVLYFQKDDCCYYRVPCIPCKKKGCEGDYCGS
jgi:hypothetical protein